MNAEEETKLIKAPVASWLETTTEQLDLIFADPPYHDPQLSTVMKLIRLLKPNGLMVLSYLSRREVPSELGVVVVDNRVTETRRSLSTEGRTLYSVLSLVKFLKK